MTIASNLRNKIIDLAERGLNAGQIAQRVPNLRRSSIHLFMATNGLHQPKRRAIDCIRNGKRFKSFSAEEDAYIEALRIQGYTHAFIGQMCGKRFGHPRTAATICIRLKMIAAQEVQK